MTKSKTIKSIRTWLGINCDDPPELGLVNVTYKCLEWLHKNALHILEMEI